MAEERVIADEVDTASEPAPVVPEDLPSDVEDDTPSLRAFYPGDLQTTAREIIRLWENRMIFCGLELLGEVPFRDVIIHSTVLAPDGRRMSKSLGPTVVSRQAAPPVYEHVASIYVLDPDYLRHANHLLDGHAEGYDIGQAKSFDIDSEFDFRIIEMLMRDKQAAHGRV